MNCAPCPAMMKQKHNEFKNSYRFQKYYSIMEKNFNIEDIQGKNFKNGDCSLNLYSTHKDRWTFFSFNHCRSCAFVH